MRPRWGEDYEKESSSRTSGDSLGDRDFRVAGEARRLEADVRELVDQVVERHAVLEGDAHGSGEGVHQAADG